MIESESGILDDNSSSENLDSKQGKQDESQALLIDDLGAKAESIEKDPRFIAIEEGMGKEWLDLDGKIPRSQPEIVTFVDEAKEQFRESFSNDAKAENITEDPRFSAIYESVKMGWEKMHPDRGVNGYWSQAYKEKLTGIIEPNLRHFDLEVEKQFRERFPNDTRNYEIKAIINAPEKIPTDRTSILVDGKWVNTSDLKPTAESS